MNRQTKDYPFFYFTLLIVFFILTTKLAAQNNITFNETYATKSAVTVQKTMEKKCFAGLVAGVSLDGTIAWSTAKGFSNIKAQRTIDAKAIFRTASIAKSMTAVAVMQLVERDLIDLDAPIQTYIPDYPTQKAGDITTRHLLSHTAGISGYESAKEAQTQKNYPRLADAVNVFKNRELKHKSGTTFYYTTYGYVVLGLIIEKVSGLTFEEYMTKNIWEKVEMNNTGVEKFQSQKPNESSLYHRNKKGKIRLAKKENNLSNRIPGGGFYSNLEDMLKFGNAVINNDLIKAETLQMMLEKSAVKKEGNPYGFGWFMYGGEPNPAAVFGHSGGQTGVSAQLMIIPDKKAVIVVFANTSGAWEEAITLSVELIHNLQIQHMEE